MYAVIQPKKPTMAPRKPSPSTIPNPILPQKLIEVTREIQRKKKVDPFTPSLMPPIKKSKPSYANSEQLAVFLDGMAQLPSTSIPKHKRCQKCNKRHHQSSKCAVKDVMKVLFG